MKRLLLLLILALAIPATAYAQVGVDVDYCDDANPDKERVIEACTALLELEPANTYAYFVRAFVQAELGRYQEAIIDYSKVLFFDQHDEYAYNNRGYAYYQLEQYEQAIADYTRALSVNPDYATARVNRGYAYWVNEQPELALAEAEYLINGDSGSAADGYYLRGALAQDAGDHQAAIEDYGRVIELDPEWSSPYLGRGFALWNLYDFAAAARDYHTWLEIEAPLIETLDADMAAEPFVLTMDGETRYLLPISGDAGDRLTARAAALTDTLDPAIVLLDASRQPIAVDDDGGGGIAELDAIIDGFPLPEDGMYFIEIGFAGGGDIGDVEVTVNLQK